MGGRWPAVQWLLIWGSRRCWRQQLQAPRRVGTNAEADSTTKGSIALIKRLLNWTPISSTLDIPWRRNACADLVELISVRNFPTLEHNFFEFAKAMIAG